jgi:hypothetical protein
LGTWSAADIICIQEKQHPAVTFLRTPSNPVYRPDAPLEATVRELLWGAGRGPLTCA